MKTILLTNNYIGKPLEIINQVIPAGFQLMMLDAATDKCLLEKVGYADYLLVSGRVKVSSTVLETGKSLRMIQRTGVGLDSLDLTAIKSKGIPLYVNQGINAESVAEHTLLLILASLRKLTQLDKNTKNGIWKKQEQGIQTHELRGKTVGIIGMGNIARSLILLLNSFHVNILYNNLSRMPEEFEQIYHLKFVSIDTLLANSDIITIHCALSDETKGLINGESIGKMKDGVILINTARGPIVVTEDLANSLKNGKIAFAGIDVYENEPIKEDCPLINLENVILTPHVAGITFESFSKMMLDAMRNIKLFDQGEFEKIQQYRYL